MNASSFSFHENSKPGVIMENQRKRSVIPTGFPFGENSVDD